MKSIESRCEQLRKWLEDEDAREREEAERKEQDVIFEDDMEVF